MAKKLSANFWKRKQSRMFKEWPTSWRKTWFLKCHLPCRAYLTALKEKVRWLNFWNSFSAKSAAFLPAGIFDKPADELGVGLDQETPNAHHCSSYLGRPGGRHVDLC